MRASTEFVVVSAAALYYAKWIIELMHRMREKQGLLGSLMKTVSGPSGRGPAKKLFL